MSSISKSLSDSSSERSSEDESDEDEEEEVDEDEESSEERDPALDDDDDDELLDVLDEPVDDVEFEEEEEDPELEEPEEEAAACECGVAIDSFSSVSADVLGLEAMISNGEKRDDYFATVFFYIIFGFSSICFFWSFFHFFLFQNPHKFFSTIREQCDL